MRATNRKPLLHWALFAPLAGIPQPVRRGQRVPWGAAWVLVGRDEWNRLRDGGYYTRRARERPGDYVDREQQENVEMTA